MTAAQKPALKLEPEVDKKDDEKKEVQDELSEILKKHEGKESDIPMNHKYWDLQARLRTLMSEK